MSFCNLILYFPFSQTQLPKRIELTLSVCRRGAPCDPGGFGTSGQEGCGGEGAGSKMSPRAGFHKPRAVPGGTRHASSLPTPFWCQSRSAHQGPLGAPPASSWL